MQARAWPNNGRHISLPISHLWTRLATASPSPLPPLSPCACRVAARSGGCRLRLPRLDKDMARPRPGTPDRRAGGESCRRGPCGRGLSVSPARPRVACTSPSAVGRARARRDSRHGILLSGLNIR
jgi:hypothetical protein